MSRDFPDIEGKTITSCEHRVVYTDGEVTGIVLGFDDGTSLELSADTIMFDQYSRDPIIGWKYVPAGTPERCGFCGILTQRSELEEAVDPWDDKKKLVCSNSDACAERGRK